MAEGAGFFPWRNVLSGLTAETVPKNEKRPPSGKKRDDASGQSSAPDLVKEKEAPVVFIPTILIGRNGAGPGDEPEWEVLSDRESTSSTAADDCGIFVAHAGSVRSISSRDQDSTSNVNLNLPFKIQRTGSSSTLDSQDDAIGPSGKGVLGVDYVEHIVLPTDTMQGICIAYKVSASNLRRANHFTGHSLHAAPKKLLIPLSKKALRTGFIRVQDTDSKEYKLHYFQVEHPDISMQEAKVYLELADWDLKHAILAARGDKEWERDVTDPEVLKAGEISIKVDKKPGNRYHLILKGAGAKLKNKSKELLQKETLVDNKMKKKGMDPAGASAKEKQKVKVFKSLPAIATKSVLPEDIYNAALEDQSFGVELKSISKKPESDDIAE